jgi:hypothetical protein
MELRMDVRRNLMRALPCGAAACGSLSGAGFGGWTLLLVVLATLNLGRTDAIGLLIQCLALLALVAIALTGFRLQLATAIALITVAMPWAGFRLAVLATRLMVAPPRRRSPGRVRIAARICAGLADRGGVRAVATFRAACLRLPEPARAEDRSRRHRLATVLRTPRRT